MFVKNLLRDIVVMFTLRISYLHDVREKSNGLWIPIMDYLYKGFLYFSEKNQNFAQCNSFNQRE